MKSQQLKLTGKYEASRSILSGLGADLSAEQNKVELLNENLAVIREDHQQNLDEFHSFKLFNLESDTKLSQLTLEKNEITSKLEDQMKISENNHC